MKIVGYLFLILAIPATSNAEPKKVTQQSVSAYISTVNNCFEKRNIECLSENLAEDVQLHIESTSGSKVSTYELTKKKYIEGMSNTWKLSPGYSYKQTSVKVTTLMSLNATYIESVTEIVPTAQATYEMVSENQVLVELVNNQLVAKKIIGKSILKAI